MMEKLLNQDDFKMYRFQCACLSAADAMDIDIKPYGEHGKYITMRFDFLGRSFWDRVKYAFAILRGNWTWREFVLREEDYSLLSDIFSKRYEEI